MCVCARVFVRPLQCSGIPLRSPSGGQIYFLVHCLLLGHQRTIVCSSARVLQVTRRSWNTLLLHNLPFLSIFPNTEPLSMSDLRGKSALSQKPKRLNCGYVSFVSFTRLVLMYHRQHSLSAQHAYSVKKCFNTNLMD